MIVSVQILNTSSLSHQYLATEQILLGLHQGTNQASNGPCPAAKLGRTPRQGQYSSLRHHWRNPRFQSVIMLAARTCSSEILSCPGSLCHLSVYIIYDSTLRYYVYSTNREKRVTGALVLLLNIASKNVNVNFIIIT